MSTDKEKLVPKEKNVIDTLDKFINRTQAIGSIDRAIGNNLWGINHRRVKGALPINKDEQGYVFFTRPQLNLSSNNIRNYRKFYSLLTTKERSIHRYVRCLLDPRLKSDSNIDSTLIDNDMAFMPILTNTVKSISGWPDVTNSSFTSKSGVRKEQFSMVDGTVDIYESFDLDVTFNNIKEEPLSLIFDTWLHYMSTVFEGTLMPYTDFITENEIDYNTRIYRIILTENKKYVKKISCTGASYPLNIPTGKFFDYTDERPYSDQTKDVTIRFKSMGALYNDDIIIKWFNDATGIFNSDMRKLNASCDAIIKKGKYTFETANDNLVTGDLEKIPDKLLLKLNNRGYPRINPITMEFEWWANKKDIEFMNKEEELDIVKTT